MAYPITVQSHNKMKKIILHCHKQLENTIEKSVKMNTYNIHDRSLSWLSAGTSIKCGGAKLEDLIFPSKWNNAVILVHSSCQ